MKSGIQKRFGHSEFYWEIIDEIVPVALRHEYSFYSDQWFNEFVKSDEFSPAQYNAIVVLELVEKAHLAAITALLRAKRWGDAAENMYEACNLLGWAASVRGLLESAGDVVDGLLQIPFALATHHRAIQRSLSQRETGNLVDLTDLEGKLDHFVHAKWMRTKGVLKAKENVEYVKTLDHIIPNVIDLYRILCSITHPSSASIEVFYSTEGVERSLRLSADNDRNAIDKICADFPDCLQKAMMMACNAPLMILRVLHKFDVHPQLKSLRKVNWNGIRGWDEIERALQGS